MNNKSLISSVLLGSLLFICLFDLSSGQDTYIPDSTQRYTIGKGWARNSVNTVIFRHKSVTSYQGNQYVAFYDPKGNMILARREMNSHDWKKHKTQFSADVNDAHNSISIDVDGEGILHVSWGMHGDTLNYAKGKNPGGLELSRKMEMTGRNENRVTYPQFYRLSSGDLVFIYRHGRSGSGDIMLNRYNLSRKNWKKIKHPVISGEEKQNAYLNTMAIDDHGEWHLSWTWRESWDVSTNHDIMYAYSPDEGETWQDSKGNTYLLPITRNSAEIAWRIPQERELINQTSMTIDTEGKPVVASYWKENSDDVPQIRIVHYDGNNWNSYQVSNRDTDFSLSGGGTKRIPLSRPQILAGKKQDLFVFICNYFESQT